MNNSLKNIHFNAFITEENDLHDLEIIDELSNYLEDSKVLMFFMLIISVITIYILSF